MNATEDLIAKLFDDNGPKQAVNGDRRRTAGAGAQARGPGGGSDGGPRADHAASAHPSVFRRAGRTVSAARTAGPAGGAKPAARAGCTDWALRDLERAVLAMSQTEESKRQFARWFVERNKLLMGLAADFWKVAATLTVHASDPVPRWG